MKKENIWIVAGSLICVVLLMFTLLALFQPGTRIHAKALPAVPEIGETKEYEEYAEHTAMRRTRNKETREDASKETGGDMHNNETPKKTGMALASFPAAFFREGSHELDGFIIVPPDAPEQVRAAALELNQELVPGQRAESDLLEIGVDYAGGAGGEWPGVSCKDLNVLCIGSAANLYHRFQYTETLFTPRSRVEYRIDPDAKGAGPQPYFFIPQENETYRYKITFLPALESINRLTASGAGRLQGIITPDTELALWGKEYVLIDAIHPKQYQLTIVIVGGIKDVLAEGEERTYEVDGDLISIKPFLINENDVQFVINGERIKPMKDDETRIIPSAGNRSIAVHEILENEATEETGDDLVEFYFGDLLELTDTNTTSPSRINELGEFVGSRVVWNKEILPQVDVSIITTLDEGLADLARVNVKSIELKYVPSDDLYGWGRLSKQAQKIELGKKGNFLNLFDIEYKGIMPAPEYRETQHMDEYVFAPGGNDAYTLAWKTSAGTRYDFDVASCTTDACTNISYGKRSGSTFYDLVVDETDTIAENEYFFLTSDARPVLMQFDNLDTEDNVITLREIVQNEEDAPDAPQEREPTYEVSYDQTTGLGYFDLYHSTFTLNVTNESAATLQADMDGDGTMTDTGISLRAAAGGDFNFSTALEPRIAYQTNELYEDSRRDELDFRPYFDAKYKRLDINVSDVSGTWQSGFNSSLATVIVNRTLEINNSDVSTGMTEYGLRAELTSAGSQNQSTLTIFAPKHQLFGFLDVFPTTFKKLLKKPADFTGYEKGHLILIGGPCENPATAHVVEFGRKETDCFLGAKKGEAVIKMYERTDKREETYEREEYGRGAASDATTGWTGGAAIVVAGNGEEATLNAIEVLKQAEKYRLSKNEKTSVVIKKENGKIRLH